MLDYKDAIVAPTPCLLCYSSPFPTGLCQPAQNTRNQCRSSPTPVPAGIQGWKVRSSRERRCSNAGRSSCGFIQCGVCESDTAVDWHVSDGLWESRSARTKEL